jgi:seryl-tRNA synthetase
MFLNSDLSILRNIFESLDKYKDRKEIELDERKLPKLHEIIRHMDFLAELKSHYNELIKNMEEAQAALKEKMEPVIIEIKKSENELSRLKKESDEVNSRIMMLSGEKKYLESLISEKHANIEVKVSFITSSQIKILR